MHILTGGGLEIETGMVEQLGKEVQSNIVYAIWNKKKRYWGIMLKSWNEDMSPSVNVFRRTHLLNTSQNSIQPPWGRWGFKSRIHPPYPQRVVKGDWRGPVI